MLLRKLLEQPIFFLREPMKRFPGPQTSKFNLAGPPGELHESVRVIRLRMSLRLSSQKPIFEYRHVFVVAFSSKSRAHLVTGGFDNNELPVTLSEYNRKRRKWRLRDDGMAMTHT
jgi:hypothetical protein